VDVDPELENPDELILDAEKAAAVREQYARDKSGPLTEIASSYAMVPFTTTIQPDALEKIRSQAQALVELSPAKKAILEQRLKDPDNIGLVEYFFKLGAGAFGGKDSRHGILAQILQQPFAAGSVHIQPKSAAKEDPVIQYGYYHGAAGDVDLELMLQSTRFARNIILAPPFNNVVKQLVLPPASVLEDDEQLKQLVLNGTRAALHAVGSCSMGGDAGIQGGVVNERLQVYGVQRLRVVDASIMPLHISAHIQATVYAIAEKAAHMILEDVAA
jgi:choline dehydrogenase-like flavoprotein